MVAVPTMGPPLRLSWCWLSYHFEFEEDGLTWKWWHSPIATQTTGGYQMIIAMSLFLMMALNPMDYQKDTYYYDVPVIHADKVKIIHE